MKSSKIRDRDAVVCHPNPLRAKALNLPPSGRVGGWWLLAEVHSWNYPWSKVMPPWGGVEEKGLVWMVEVEKSGNVLV